jgi:hypothetical protein
MLSRALNLATVTLLIGCFAAIPVRAQNLEAGKSPSQIFAGTCNACHKSPRGLLKTVQAGSLPGFLRQHYTTSSEMASLLSAFLVSNGATDTRYVGTQPKAASKDGKPEARPAGPPDQLDRFGRRLRPALPPPQEAAKPDAEPQQAAKPDEAVPPQTQGGRNAKRLARPGEAPDAANPAVDGQAPAQAALEPGPDGRKSGPRQKLGKRGRPGSEEAPKTDAAKGEPAKGEPATDDAARSETAKGEGGKPAGEPKSESAKSESAKSESAKSESAKTEPPKEGSSGEAPALRADPVPPVTPAPLASPAVSAAVATGTPEPAAAPPTPAPAPAPAPAVTVSAPPLPPVVPAGPPAPPISQ